MFFVVFDIESFTCVFQQNCLISISFAKLYYDFTSDELEIVMRSKKTLLFWQDNAWVKKEGDEDFDLPIGCYDGAEICKLVGIYILNKLCKLMNKKDFGLYRDDGLGIFRNTFGPEADQKRKNIKIFKECGLSITCEINKKIVDFVDVRFNLNDQTNNEPVYINKQLNHPPNIIADMNVDIYQTALKNSGFPGTIIYNDQSEEAKNINIEEANQA